MKFSLIAEAVLDSESGSLFQVEGSDVTVELGRGL
jgi:hypothetical protein